MERNPDTRDPARPPALLSPTVTFLVCACLVVATAVYLGADWLRTPSLGLPVGVWIVLLGTVAAGYVRRAARQTDANVRRPLRWSPALPARWRGAIRRGFHVPIRLARWFGVTHDRLRQLEDVWSARIGRLRLPAAPIRIGVALPADFDAAIRRSESPLNVQWVPVEQGGDGERECRELGLDALVHGSSGVLRVTTPENPGRDAAWYDWSSPRPLSYASIFPGRVDPGRVTIADADTLTPGDAPAVRAIIEAAAVLSRTPSRLSLADRLLGREWWGSRRATTHGAAPSVEFVMLRLARILGEPGGTAAVVLRPAARAVGAWLASAPADVDVETRRLGVEAAARILSSEPEAQLRLAAVRVAAGQDQNGMEALVAADRMLREHSVIPFADQLAFIEAEASLPQGDPLTTGRVAAGAALVAACSAPDRLAVLRDDLMDDLRYSGWLVGRDQDRALLLDVFRALDRARAAETARAAA